MYLGFLLAVGLRSIPSHQISETVLKRIPFDIAEMEQFTIIGVFCWVNKKGNKQHQIIYFNIYRAFRGNVKIYLEGTEHYENL